jgi:hypothetical protein
VHCLFCRLHHPILLAQWQEGVTRVDLVKVFSFEEFMKVRSIYSTCCSVYCTHSVDATVSIDLVMYYSFLTVQLKHQTSVFLYQYWPALERMWCIECHSYSQTDSH